MAIAQASECASLRLHAGGPPRHAQTRPDGRAAADRYRIGSSHVSTSRADRPWCRRGGAVTRARNAGSTSAVVLDLPTPSTSPHEDGDGDRDKGVVVRDLPQVSVGDAYDLVKRLPARSVDCVVTSPPYWGLRSYGHDHDETLLDRWQHAQPHKASRQQLRTQGPGYDWYRTNGGVLGLEPYPDWFVTHLVEIFARLQPALKLSGSLWVNLGDTYFARWSSIRSDGRQGLGQNPRTRRVTPTGDYLQDKQLLMVPARFAIAMQEAGWILRNDVIWSKVDVPPRPKTDDRLKLSHEHFFHFVRRRKDRRASYYYDLSSAEDGARDVVQVSRGRGRDGHSATFPAAIIEPRIASSCPPGGLVVDPFCGTGRTLEVAIESGRRSHGIELSTSFAQAARANARRAKARLAGIQESDVPVRADENDD